MGLFLLLVLFCIPQVKGQQPAHFMLGEDEFKGIQIYDIIQDNDLNYWFATNDGVYYFDYYKYHRIDCQDAKSLVVFNFIKDNEGTIYCNNLNNQVFQIKNKKCSLFYEIPLEDARSDVSLIVDGQGNVLVGSKKIILINHAGKVLRKFPVSGYLGQPLLLKENKVIYHIASTDTLIVYFNHNFSKCLLWEQGKGKSATGCLRFFQFNQKTFAVDIKSRFLFEFLPTEFKLLPLGTNEAFERGVFIHTYSVNEALWITGTLHGVSYVKNNILDHSNGTFFEDYFISEVFMDAEGSILLGTFDRGVIVIPDLSIPDVINSFQDDPVTSLNLKSDSTLFMGTSKGRLLKYENNKIATISQSGERPIEGIYTTNESKYVIYDDGGIRFLDYKTGKNTTSIKFSLKDAVLVDEKNWYLATNTGVIHYQMIRDGEWEHNWIDFLRMRTYSIDYNHVYQLVYVSTSDGVFAINKQHDNRPILYNGQKIFTNDLYSYKDALYILSKKNGLLKVMGTNVAQSIELKINNQPIRLNKFIVYNDVIYIRSGNMLYAFSLQGKYKGNLGEQHGFISHRVLDFCISKGVLWVSHTGGVQQINLSFNRSVISRPKSVITSILVNEINLSNRQHNAFSSDQRKIRFQLTSPSLRNRGIINFQYKLQGYDNNWISTAPGSNEVVYNALEPGHYTFKVRAENQGLLGNVASFSFSIASPLYRQWWFLGIWIFLFVLIVLLIYRRQISSQRKKAQYQNELNALKLTAIQSQMNPHFIFNSLNAIQDLVLKGDVDNSYTFITRFSDLVRRTLNYSDKDYIEFEQEIQLIQLYLSLEKLRFKDQLLFSLNTNSIDDIMIPPMLIQPFIENALIHGLLHKEGLKTIKIEFELDHMLICRITDNGVGRKKSAEIKMRQRSNHESFSGSAIKRRFEILSHHNHVSVGYEYQDLEENGEASGTMVTIRIPVKRKF